MKTLIEQLTEIAAIEGPGIFCTGIEPQEARTILAALKQSVPVEQKPDGYQRFAVPFRRMCKTCFWGDDDGSNLGRAGGTRRCEQCDDFDMWDPKKTDSIQLTGR